jgi:O-antigen ligase
VQLLASIKKYYFIVGCLLICLGFPLFEVSPAFLSIGTVICALAVFEGRVIENLKKFITPPALLFLVLWLWLLASGIYSDDIGRWSDRVSRKLSLVLLPLGMVSVTTLTKKQVWLIFFVFNCVITFFAVASAINYFQNFEAINASMIESKSVPVWPIKKGISHIYFGVLTSFCIVNSVFFSLNEKTKVLFAKDRIVMGSLALLNIIIIHMLSARTGLVAVYGGLGILVLHWVWRHRKKKVVWLLLVALPLLPVAAYYTVPSFQNKIKNSVRDIEINRDGGDINHRSFSMRLEAWKMGINLIQQNPVIGVGAGDLDDEMQAEYNRTNSVLWQENRVMPHNQFIENAVQMGIPYSLFLLIVIFFPLIKWRKTSPLLWACAFMFFFAMCFESILERQIGVVLFPFVYFLGGFLPAKEN